MKYDFDEVINRRNTHSAKWDTQAKKYKRNDLIHLGVADMDFKASKEIESALYDVIKNGVYGYTDIDQTFYESIKYWYKNRYEILLNDEEIIFSPRITESASIVVETMTNPGNSVMMNVPGYSSLQEAVEKNARIVQRIPLQFSVEAGWKMDFDLMQSSVTTNTKMFILISPDNPSGTVWSKEDLEKLVLFCKKNDLILFSDEIHSDNLKNGIKYTSILECMLDYDHVIMANSVTKTFNIPGSMISYLVIKNESIRNKVTKRIDELGIHNPNIFSLSMFEAGYMKSEDWLVQVNKYIDENDEAVRKFFEGSMPEFDVYPREGGYTLWVNYSRLKVAEEKLMSWFIEDAKVEVYSGKNFGPEGENFFRMNIATSRKTLNEALQLMKDNYQKLK